jgi:hypothetical protein
MRSSLENLPFFGSDTARRVATAGVIVAAAFMVMVPVLISPQWPRTHDGYYAFSMTQLFWDAISNGVWYPRWFPDVYGGYGYPSFVYYQPAFFYLTLPFSWLPGGPPVAVYTLVFLLLVPGGFGAYLLCARLSDRLTGLFCATLFLVTPYLFVNLHVRGAFSEFMGIDRLMSGGPPLGAVTGLVLSLTLLFYSHPAVTMFMVPAFCVMALVLTFRYRTGWGLPLRAAGALLFAIVVSTPYWLVVFQMKPYAQYGVAMTGGFEAAAHTVFPGQFFSTRWEFGGAAPWSAEDGMSYQLGLVHFVLATVGVVFAQKMRFFIRACYTLYVGLILMMSPLSSPLWASVELLSIIQFPWRILSVTATLQLVCISGISGLLVRAGWVRGNAIVLAITFLVTLAWHHEQFRTNFPRDYAALVEENIRMMRYEFHRSFTGLYEVLPASAQVPMSHPLGDAPDMVLQGPGTAQALPEHTRYRMRYQVEVPDAAILTINQIYLPGWRVVMNGTALPRPTLEGSLLPDGRMTFQIPAGRHVIDAYYKGPPGGTGRTVAIVIALMAFGAYGAWERRRTRHPAH